MAASNFKVLVTSDDLDILPTIVQLACADQFATHFQVSTETNGSSVMHLFWHEQSGASALPYPMKHNAIAEMVKDWLRQLPNTAYPACPDFDGSVERGFTVEGQCFCGWSYEFLRITPAWALYGK